MPFTDTKLSGFKGGTVVEFSKSRKMPLEVGKIKDIALANGREDIVLHWVQFKRIITYCACHGRYFEEIREVECSTLFNSANCIIEEHDIGISLIGKKNAELETGNTNPVRYLLIKRLKLI